MLIKNENNYTKEITYNNKYNISPYKSFYIHFDVNNKNERFKSSKPLYYKYDNKWQDLRLNDSNRTEKKSTVDYKIIYYENVRKAINLAIKSEVNKVPNYTNSKNKYLKRYIMIAKQSHNDILPNNIKKVLFYLNGFLFFYNVIIGIYFLKMIPKILFGNYIFVLRKMIPLGLHFCFTNTFVFMYKLYNYKKSFNILYGNLNNHEILGLLEEYEREFSIQY